MASIARISDIRGLVTQGESSEEILRNKDLITEHGGYLTIHEFAKIIFDDGRVVEINGPATFTLDASFFASNSFEDSITQIIDPASLDFINTEITTEETQLGGDNNANQNDANADVGSEQLDTQRTDNQADTNTPTPLATQTTTQGAATLAQESDAQAPDTTTPTAAAATPDTEIVTPTIDLTASSDSGVSSTDNLTNDTTPTFTGTGEPGATVTLTSSTGVVLGTAIVAENGTFTITATTLPEGENSLTVTTTDQAGNSSFANITIEIDITAEGTVTVNAITTDDVINAEEAGGNVTVSGTTTGEFAQGDKVTFTVNGNDYEATVDENGNWSVPVAGSDLAADTEFTVTATGTDEAGNPISANETSTHTVDTTVTVDADLATTSDTGISNSDDLTKDNTPTITGQTDAGAVVVITDKDGNEVGRTTADSNGNYSITTTVLADGVQALTITATDPAGNVATTTQTVNVDTQLTQPTADIVDSSDTSRAGLEGGTTDNITADSTPTITGQTDAGVKVEIFDKNGNKVGETTADENGNYEITTSTLPDGAQNLVIKATDDAGNTSETTQEITVDTTITNNVLGMNDEYNYYWEDYGQSGSGGNVLVFDEKGAAITAGTGTHEGKYGTFTLNPDGSYTYRVKNGEDTQALGDGEIGKDTFTYTVTDEAGNSYTRSVTYGVNGRDDATVTQEDAMVINEDATATGNVLTNDSDVDDDLSVASYKIEGSDTIHNAGNGVLIEGKGTIVINSDGSYTFTPVNNYNGEVPTITYTTNTGATAELNITVNAVDDTTVTANDTKTIDEDTTATGNVLTNDTDIDSTLTVSGFTIEGSNTVHNAGDSVVIDGKGTIVINSDGSYTFTPAENYNGEVPTITYTTNTGATADLDININAVDDETVAVNDTKTIDEDTTASGNVLTNDSDVDSAISVQTFTIAGSNIVHNAGDSVEIAGKGTIVINSDGSYTFTPVDDFNGEVPTISYTTNTGASADLDIDVTAVNDGPTATAKTDEVNEDSTISGQISANDIDGDDLTFSVKEGATTPTGLTLNSDGTYTFDASSYDSLKEGQTQTIEVPITVSDSKGGTTETTLTIDVKGQDNDLTFQNDGGAYKNVVGYYELDSDGNPISPATIVVDDQNGIAVGTHLSDLDAGKEYGFFIIPNGANLVNSNTEITFDTTGDKPQLVINGNNSNAKVMHDNPEFNSDSKDYFKMEDNGQGGTTIKIEDIPGGGDQDYDDVILNSDVAITDKKIETKVVNDTKTIDEDQTATGNVLDNDTSVNPLSVATFTIAGDSSTHNVGDSVTIADKGIITMNADGSYTFVPVEDYSGDIPTINYTTTTGETGQLDIDINAIADDVNASIGVKSVKENTTETTSVNQEANEANGIYEKDGKYYKKEIQQEETQEIDIDALRAKGYTIDQDGKYYEINDSGAKVVIEKEVTTTVKKVVDAEPIMKVATEDTVVEVVGEEFTHTPGVIQDGQSVTIDLGAESKNIELDFNDFEDGTLTVEFLNAQGEVIGTRTQFEASDGTKGYGFGEEFTAVRLTANGADIEVETLKGRGPSQEITVEAGGLIPDTEAMEEAGITWNATEYKEITQTQDITQIGDVGNNNVRGFNPEDHETSQVFDFGEELANRKVTITIDLEVKGDWDNNDYSTNDFFTISANGQQVDTNFYSYRESDAAKSDDIEHINYYGSNKTYQYEVFLDDNGQVQFDFMVASTARGEIVNIREIKAIYEGDTGYTKTVEEIETHTESVLVDAPDKEVQANEIPGGVPMKTVTTPVEVEVETEPIMSTTTQTESFTHTLDISASLTDLDGSETLTVTLEGIPNEVTLDNGTKNDDGTWTIEVGDAKAISNEIAMTIPEGKEDFTVTIKAVGQEKGTNLTKTVTKEVEIDVDDVSNNFEPANATLVGEMTFDADSTTSGPNGRVDDGQVGEAGQFNSKATVMEDLDLNTGAGEKTTITMWFKHTNQGTGDWDMLAGSNNHDLTFNGNMLGFNTWQNDLYGFDATEFNDGEWHQITAVFTNGDVTQNKIYIDGEEQTLSQMKGSPNNSRAYISNDDGDITIGGETHEYNGYNFNGQLDEVKVFKGELSAEEAKELYDIEKAGETAIEDTTNSGTLVDGVVEGIFYETSSGITGYTDANGTFKFNDGDSITFKVGGVTLGVATAEDVASGKTFLQDIADVDRGDLNDEYLENMAVFLQSIDTPDSGDNIVITKEMHEKLENANIDLRTASEEEVQNLVESVGGTYVDENDAMQHVKDMLQEYTDMQENDFEQRVEDSDTNSATLGKEPLAGIEYETSSGIKGITDENGNFEYNDDDNITFLKDGEAISTIEAKDIGDDNLITMNELKTLDINAPASNDEIPELDLDKVAAIAEEESSNSDAEETDVSELEIKDMLNKEGDDSLSTLLGEDKDADKANEEAPKTTSDDTASTATNDDPFSRLEESSSELLGNMDNHDTGGFDDNDH